MDGGVSFMPRQSTKRTFSTMMAAHSPDLPSMSSSHDDHYSNEHTARRRRFMSPLEPPVHFPGDGLDFRRPITSNSASASLALPRMNEGDGGSQEAPLIDLTSDTSMEEAAGTNNQAAQDVGNMAGSSRAQRLPRFGRDVIDLDSDGEVAEHDTSHLPGSSYLALPPSQPVGPHRDLRDWRRLPSPRRRDMEGLEILETRPVSHTRPLSRRHSPAAAAQLRPRHSSPRPNAFVNPIDLTQEDDNDVVLVDERQREGVNMDAPGMMEDEDQMNRRTDAAFGALGPFSGLIRQGGRLFQRLQGYAFAPMDDGIENIRPRVPRNNSSTRDRNAERREALHQVRRTHNRNHRHHHHHHHNHRHAVAALGPAFLGTRGPPATIMPGLMDYAATGFALEVDDRPPTPKYTAPPEPAAGFTRSPVEDEVVVCPNCGDELAMGDNEIKQQIWVVKSCGHVYCGECAVNRNRSLSRKGKDRVAEVAGLPPPFRKCVVEGCGKNTRTSMVHVFLGS